MKTAEEILYSIYQSEYASTKPGNTFPEHHPDYVLKGMKEYADQFKPKFINVNDELPESKGNYLCLSEQTENPFVSSFENGKFNTYALTISHWMELPDKPDKNGM